MATYLVTGGAGFIGSNLARELVRRRHRVVVLDNISTGRLQNLADIKEKITFIKGDIRTKSTVQLAVKGVDYILHHAALRAVERSVDNPYLSHETNVTGTLNILMAAKEAKVKRVVFASSSAVYGELTGKRNVETTLAAPESPYAVSKLAGEQYCTLFAKLYGVSTVSLRYFNVFGPYQNPESRYSNVIPMFVSQLLNNETPTIHWHGRQARDFTYVGNVVEANLLAVTQHLPVAGPVYNIGNGVSVSINTLYQELQKLLNTYRTPHHSPKRAGDVLKTLADISRAKRELGYRPHTSFKAGLAQSIAWYIKHLPQ